jgi:hypothetical protein
VLLLLFQVGLNLPHYFQTYTLTYFDPEVREHQAPRLWGALTVAITVPVAACLLGPAVLHATLVVITLWGLWHITQQSRGLVGLYVRRGAGSAQLRQRLLMALFAGSVAAVAWRIAHHGLSLSGESLPLALPVALALGGTALGAFALALTELNAARLPAFGLTALHVAIFALAVTVVDLNLVLVIATSWHALQYLALTYRVQLGKDDQRLFARLAQQETVLFFAVAVVFAIAAAGLGAALPKPWGQAIYLPLLLLHYLNDAWLWRPDRNPAVKEWLAPLGSPAVR